MQQLQPDPDLPTALEFHIEPSTTMAKQASPAPTTAPTAPPIPRGVKLDLFETIICIRQQDVDDWLDSMDP